MTQLRDATLAELAGRVPVPEYDRARVSTGIVHFGVGGFHRAHEAMYIDRLLADGTAEEWGITGVGVLPQDQTMAEVMLAQDCLYTLVVKDSDGSMQPRVIGSIVDYLFAPSDPEKVLDLMAAPTTRIVSLTVTEGGYHINQTTGAFEDSDPAIGEDVAAGRSGQGLPTTAVGFLTEALARRRAAGVDPFTVVSCDNIEGNGERAREMVVGFATLRDEGLGAWIGEHVSFPSSMVDRITPATTDGDRARLLEEFGIEDGWPVVCEPFAQWALEDAFPTGRPPLEDVEVQVVDDVVPYELMKLRLLNAGHQALGYLGCLSGYRYADEACQDPLFSEFLLAYMEHEATPTLQSVPGVDLAEYRHRLIERFANPEIGDTLARLCANSSDRIPQWLVPVVQRQLETGGQVHRAALVIAAWARYAEGVDEEGETIDVVDRRRDQVMARAARQVGPDGDPLAFLDDRDLFGDLRDQQRFTDEYTAALDSLHVRGARATLEDWRSR